MVEVERAKMTDKAMRICDNKGFQLDLPNGITVSVQWGPGNYVDHDVKNADFDAPAKAAADGKPWGSNTAECAAFLTDGDDLQWVAVPGFTGKIHDDDDDFWDDVVGNLDVEGVLDFINLASQLDATKNPVSLGDKLMGYLEKHGDYRDDLVEDERKVMNNNAIDEFFSGLVKFSGTNYKDN
jgi:hypothetical protein